MFKKIRHSRSGFTLMEMLVVLTIIGILMGLSVLPYGDFMNRARLSNTVDRISQEWIIAHKEVRNGQEFPDTDKTHATEIFKFETGKNYIEKYLYKTDITDGKVTSIANPGILNFTDTNKFFLAKTIELERGIQVLSLAGVASTAMKNFNKEEGVLYYVIEPPYGNGVFIKEDGTNIGNEKKIIVGYEGAEYAISNAKEISLRTYLR